MPSLPWQAMQLAIDAGLAATLAAVAPWAACAPEAVVGVTPAVPWQLPQVEVIVAPAICYSVQVVLTKSCGVASAQPWHLMQVDLVLLPPVLQPLRRGSGTLQGLRPGRWKVERMGMAGPEGQPQFVEVVAGQTVSVTL